MNVPSEKYANVEHLLYTKVDDQEPNHLASIGPKANGASALRVEFTYRGKTYTYDIANGDFRLDNSALQFLAYIGVKPSDFDGQSLSIDHTERVPIVRNGKDTYAIGVEALEMGADRLEDAVWFPTPDDEEGESSETAAHSGSGGGDDDDDGSPTRSGEADADVPDDVVIENEHNERGLTIAVE